MLIALRSGRKPSTTMRPFRRTPQSFDSGSAIRMLMMFRSPTFKHRHMARLLLLASAVVPGHAFAQAYALTPPVFEVVDENLVSMMSGRTQIQVPLVTIGGLTFKTANTTGIGLNSVYDDNYGRVISCLTPTQYGGSPGMVGECAGGTQYPTVQAILGAERSNFSYINGQYIPEQNTGETLVDANNGYCTWTRKDGTQIIYYDSSPGDPVCSAGNVAKVIAPNGKITDYHYYGSASTTPYLPILSLTSNDGFMLKYNYPSTPAIGAQSSVVGINRAFQACDPDALTCATSLAWPTGTIAFQAGSGGLEINKVVMTDQKQQKYIFGLDYNYRLINYRPPGADVPLYSYLLCSRGYYDPNTLTTTTYDCGAPGPGFYYNLWNVPEPPFDSVTTVTKNGQTWLYGGELSTVGNYPSYMQWTRRSTSPLGIVKSAVGSSTPNDWRMGATGGMSDGTGTSYGFAASLNNPLVYQTNADGGHLEFGYDGRNNVTSISQYPSSGSAPALVRTASYPGSCTNMKTCNQPDYFIDANHNRTDLTYDANHGGVLTETGPAVNGIHPQKRYTYVQRYAWYLSSTGVMTKETRPIWLLNSESHCISGAPAASGTGCSLANDEVVTTYDYGPDSGPNTLLLRGRAVTWNGQTRRVCYGHDRNGNKIWESAPNAAPASCPAY